MSYKNASLVAYDVMDKIHVVANVYQTDSLEKRPPELVYHEVVTFPGEGEEDPVGWLRDALIYLLETL